jgi:hypothetical protein
MDKELPLYLIVREKTFDKKIQSLAKSYSRLDDVDNAIDFALQRCPERFNKIDGDFYWWKFDSTTTGFPQLIITYRFIPSEGKVILIDAMEVIVTTD